jgi:hypothetical protein
MKKLFEELYSAKNEQELEFVIKENSTIFNNENWKPLGGNYSNFGVIENQQSSPIAALIEKITNSIDALLMKRCLEEGINPKSNLAPKSMDEAINLFYKDNSNWDLSLHRKRQAENIQIIASGQYKDRAKNTSLIIYDNGEGQNPDNFEHTFLSLLEGNKNEIHFVQGKYNMGGSGAIVFCGKKRYQLIASKRYDKSGEFGFTLVREHPLTIEEEKTRKNTWYEYLIVGGNIPSFIIETIDLGLHNRLFETGTIIKLYSYDLPSGSRSVISRDLNQSINEFLFEPALPIYTIDQKERYPEDRNLERDIYGLKRRIEQNDNKYIHDYFSEDFDEELFGKMKVTCYIFKNKIDKKSVKESKDSIRREFFKNNMSVLFSINGQVHGFLTFEFISRSLKMSLLKNHLIIHVDCTEMKYKFRKELFMASRDRLKGGEETHLLRQFLAKKLRTKSGRLAEIEKFRKESISVDSGDTNELLKSFTKSLPMNSDLMKLLNQTFKLDLKKDKPKINYIKEKVKKETLESFNPERFPSFFKLQSNTNGNTPVAKVPLSGEKTIKFETDVENHYFDRVDEPGELKIALLNFKENDTSGGKEPGKIEKVEELFNVNKSSPKDGTIKIHLNPKESVKVGDEIQIQVDLTSPGNDLKEIFWVKITAKTATKVKLKKEELFNDDKLGLPKFTLVYKDKKENAITWEQFEESMSEGMDYSDVMYPSAKGENLEEIFINMDSNVIKTFKSKNKNASLDQMEVADKKYISSVYFHTLFLFTITKNRKYIISKENDDNPIDLSDYLKDLFQSYYSEFILNFGSEQLMQSLGD